MSFAATIKIACAIAKSVLGYMTSSKLQEYKAEIEKLKKFVADNKETLSTEMDVSSVENELDSALYNLQRSSGNLSGETTALLLDSSYESFNSAKAELDAYLPDEDGESD